MISLVIAGVWGLLSRVGTLGAAARQLEKVEQNGTSLNMTLYGDPEGARGAFEMFQYVELHSLTWRGALPKPYPLPPGPPPPEGDIELELSYGEFQKIEDNRWTGKVEELNVHVVANDLVNVVVQADNVDVELEFWTSQNDLPALNLTAELTGNVYIYLFAAVLPIQGLQLALYEFSGDYFVISVSVIKPIEVTIVNPLDGIMVNGDVEIEAEVKTAPGISIENVECWTENLKEGMWYDGTDDLWKAVWPSYYTGNGWHELVVRAEGVEDKAGTTFRHPGEDRIKVEVNNPWVESSLIKPDGWEEWIDRLEIKLEYKTWTWPMETPFNFYPWIGLNLTVPEQLWDDPSIPFDCWKIEDEFVSSEPRLTITEDIHNQLFDGDGKARPLRCIYVEKQQP